MSQVMYAIRYTYRSGEMESSWLSGLRHTTESEAEALLSASAYDDGVERLSGVVELAPELLVGGRS